ncbi:F-box/FBD/LRR-repeat protein At1g13570-like [Carex rostrata]
MTNISSIANCDFISGLPDPILHRILECLKAKEAVRTCVLSKRWQHVWTSLPSLDFNFDFTFDDDFDLFQGRILSESEDDDDRPYMKSYDAFREKVVSRRFVKFVNTFLLRRKPLDLDVFRLFCHRLCSRDVGFETDWIHYAVNHNIRILHLSLVGSEPWCIYTCTSLEELYLYQISIDSPDQIVNLPNLRKLNICSVDLNPKHVKNLLSGCPVLEFLRLDTCFFSECIISHECLKHLAIVNCMIEGTQLFISTPNLLSFLYDGKLSSSYKTTINMPSLTSSCLMSRDNYVSTSLEGMATFLRFLANVELLELHFQCVWNKEWLQHVLPLELQIFEKLENVTVAFCMFSCFQMVTWVLKSSPNLKKLTILQREGCLSYDENRASSSLELTNASLTIAASSNKKLEIVEVKYWIYDKMVRRLVDTLMDCTKELKNLKFHLSKYESTKQYLKI